MSIHPIVLATIRRDLAEAELRLAILESRREELPVLTGSSSQASRLARQIKEMRAQVASWTSVERQAAG